MSDSLVILGAGQQGRNCKRLAIELGIEIKAFVDDYVTEDVEGIKVYSKIEDIPDYSESKYIVAFGEMGVREKYIYELSRLGLKGMTLIDPTAVIEDGAVIGEGNYIYKLVTVYASAVIGNHNIVNTKACIATDAVIGDDCNIYFGANICGGCHIGDHSVVKYNSTVASGNDLGKYVEVEANSVVYTDVPDGMYVSGVVVKAGELYGKA